MRVCTEEDEKRERRKGGKWEGTVIEVYSVQLQGLLSDQQHIKNDFSHILPYSGKLSRDKTFVKM